MPKILLLLGFAVLALALLYQGQIKDSWEFVIDKATLFYDNYFSPTGKVPERNRPVTLIKNQTELAVYFGEPFRNFGKGDWDEFWSIVYGGFPLEESGTGLPTRMRQLSREEIRGALIERYPQPFIHYDEGTWKKFFDTLFAK